MASHSVCGLWVAYVKPILVHHYICKGIISLCACTGQPDKLCSTVLGNLWHFLQVFSVAQPILPPALCSKELLIYFVQCADCVGWGRFPFITSIKALWKFKCFIIKSVWHNVPLPDALFDLQFCLIRSRAFWPAAFSQRLGLRQCKSALLLFQMKVWDHLLALRSSSCPQHIS